MAAFGGWITIVTSTLTSGAPPNTSGITYTGSPPVLNAPDDARCARCAERPAMVAFLSPLGLNPPSPPWAESVTTGTITPIRK
jgi:hypothetical protein